MSSDKTFSTDSHKIRAKSSDFYQFNKNDYNLCNLSTNTHAVALLFSEASMPKPETAETD